MTDQQLEQLTADQLNDNRAHLTLLLLDVGLQCNNDGDIGQAVHLLRCGCDYYVIRYVPHHCIEFSINHRSFSHFDGDPGHLELHTFRFRLYLPPNLAPGKVTPQGVKTDYTRDELLNICLRAAVPEEQWANRDTPHAMVKTGLCYGLLLGGRSFEILTAGNQCVTDEDTIWLDIDGEAFYLPTPKRLDECQGRDWY